MCIATIHVSERPENLYKYINSRLLYQHQEHSRGLSVRPDVAMVVKHQLSAAIHNAALAAPFNSQLRQVWQARKNACMQFEKVSNFRRPSGGAHGATLRGVSLVLIHIDLFIIILFWSRGLKNDSTAEVLRVATRSEEGELSPVLFIKIVPLLSWGPSFNFSIWYVELLGKDDPLLVRSTLQRYSMVIRSNLLHNSLVASCAIS